MSFAPPRFRGYARTAVLYGLAGAAYFPLTRVLLDWSGLAGSLPLGVAVDLGFVAVSAAFLDMQSKRSQRRMRQINERLESEALARAADLRHAIAGRAKAETRFREAEARFHDIAEASAEFIWEMDQDGAFSYVSPRFTEITGLQARSFIGKTASDLFGSGNLDDTPFGTWLNSRRPFRDVTVAMAAGTSGRLMVLSGRPVFDATGTFGGYRGVGSDITERRRIELSTERLRQRQDLILESLGEGVFGLDRDGKITFVNPAAQDMLGWTARELVGRNAAEILHPDPPGSLTAAQNKGSERSRMGATFRRKDGSELPVDYVWANLTEQGQVIGSVVALRDVTDQQRIDLELIFAKERAEAATRAKSEFLAHMSHELRTPLNSIMGFADVMLGEYFGPIENVRYKNYLTDIRRSGEHLLELINDVVDLSRIEAGRLNLDAQPCDMAQLVDEVFAMIRPLAAQSGCSLTNNVPGNLPPLTVDARRIKQVLLNLLSNAVKFTKAEGRVTVQAQIEADGTFRLDVIDTGIGIPDSEIDRVTQVFVQGDNALVREKGGAGLGLPLAKQLIELHGGALKIASIENQGTTVSLTLPPNRLNVAVGQ